MRKITLFIALGLFASVLFFYLRSPIDPVSWQVEPMATLSGKFEANNKLDTVSLLGQGQLNASEDIAFDDEGWLHTGLENGAIVKFKPDQSSNIIEVTNTGGRPLGMRFNKQGNLIVADAIKGILSVTPSGDVDILVDSFEGEKIVFVDHLDVADNGDIYFSNASQKYDVSNYLLDFLEASATGQVLKYDAATQETELLIDNLFFGNGIALSPNDAFLLVNETGRSRVLKHILTGENAGTTNVFIDKLPAMPDNIYFDENETFWIGLITLRDWRIEKLATYPTIRKIIGGVPLSMLKPSSKYGFVLGVDLKGNVTHNYQGASAYTEITSAVPHKGKLYLGSLYNNAIGVFDYAQQ